MVFTRQNKPESLKEKTEKLSLNLKTRNISPGLWHIKISVPAILFPHCCFLCFHFPCLLFTFQKTGHTSDSGGVKEIQWGNNITYFYSAGVLALCAALQSYHLWQGAITEVDRGGATSGTGKGPRGAAKSSRCQGF